jgi:hypothetical protein
MAPRPGAKSLQLRRADRCAACSAELAAGQQALWYRGPRMVTCISCTLEALRWSRESRARAPSASPTTATPSARSAPARNSARSASSSPVSSMSRRAPPLEERRRC